MVKNLTEPENLRSLLPMGQDYIDYTYYFKFDILWLFFNC